MPLYSVSAQTVQFSMNVQPELGIEVLQDLNFGTVISNSGTVGISLGESRMGIFKLKALAAQSAVLSIQKPEFLKSEVSNSKENIPVTIEAAYAKTPTEFKEVLHFRDNLLQITLGEDNPSNLSPSWETGYVYIYGDVIVGPVAEGSYSGTLTLNVTYQ
ncbi:hypothetical protein [Halalkalibaculum roseum]|nr:hypothetical protein [Halalkalibaculum roseum]